MIPVDEHLEAVLTASDPLPPRRVSLQDAHGCILAESVSARVDLPGFDNSAMDGYAVRFDDVAAASTDAPVSLRVVADIPAGCGDDPALSPGACARIMTGAPVPSSADTIVPFESTTLGTAVAETPPEVVEVTRPGTRGAHIRRAGEDMRAGTQLLPAGVTLTARALATVAAAGVSEVAVTARPRVAVIATGSELIDPSAAAIASETAADAEVRGDASATPPRGQLFDSNTPMVSLLAAEAGAEVVGTFRADDSGESLLRVITSACANADVVITTGGVSVGAFDVVRLHLAERGVRFTKVAMQPGKPQGFGRVDGALVFCLPGNPVSALVSFEAFVRPALRRLRGEVGPLRESREAVAGEAWSSPQGRMQLMPIRWVGADTVVPAHSGGSGSHMVGRIALAEGLAVVPPDRAAVRAGDRLEVWEILA